MPEPQGHPFVKYVSPVAGHHVERYGTRTVIGGRRQPAPPGTGELDPNALDPSVMFERGAGKLEIDEAAIVALTREEWRLYSREYGRALKRGALKKRTAAEFWGMVDEQERAGKAAAENSLAEGIGKMPEPPPSATLPRTAEETEAMCEPIGLPEDELAALRAECPLDGGSA
jgi:hypothetical protein